MNIAENTIVAIDYVLTNDEGEELDSSKDRQPMTYFHGVGRMIPGLELELDGKAPGDSFQVTVAPEAGYGVRHEEMVQDIPRDRFPEDMELEVGQTLQAQTPGGVQMVTIVGVEEDHVRLDGNHPLAGVTLHFDVTVREVREAAPEEIARAHGHDGACGSTCSGCDEH